MNRLVLDQTGEVVMELAGEKVPPFMRNDSVVDEDGFTTWPTYSVQIENEDKPGADDSD